MEKKKYKFPIRHIGVVIPICGALIQKDPNAPAYMSFHESLREDLGYERYKVLGIHERFSNQKPYRICEKCLSIIAKKEGRTHKVRNSEQIAKLERKTYKDYIKDQPK